MTRFLSIIFAVIILSILIIIHEFGHFILAKKNGIFVKEFSVGFGPRIISKVARSGTRFSWKAIPFGGSCIMLGSFEDEDDGTDDEKSYDKKSVWARMSVTLAGPFFNFLLAFVLAVIYIAAAGYDPATVTYVDEDSAAYEAGLREGDVITKYAGKKINFGREIYVEDYIKPVEEYTDGIEIEYLRDGEKTSTVLYPKETKGYMLGIGYTTADESGAEITSVSESSGAEKGGIKVGDIIIAVNGVQVQSGDDLKNYFKDHEMTDEAVEITYTRRGGEFNTTIYPTVMSTYSTGFSYNLANVKTNALGTLKYSFAEMKYEIVTVFKSIRLLLSDRGSLDMLSGPVGIVEIVSDTYTSASSYGILSVIMSLMSITTMLSVNLGVLNLLPIPALDGGKFVLLIIEAIVRKPVPKKAEGIMTAIGAALLLVLACVVLVNDVIKIL